MLYNRYTFGNILKLFLLISLVVILIALIYAFVDFLLAFKEREPSIAVKYSFFVALAGFYILSPITLSLSILLFLRRLIQKRHDIVFQALGFSPLRIVSIPLILALLLSGFNLLMSNDLYPWLIKNIWLIEKNYKKKQETGTLVRDFWFIKEDKKSKLYVYIGSLDINSGNFSDLFLLKANEEAQILKVLKCDLGIWQGNRIEVIFGTEYDFSTGSFKENLSGDVLEVEVRLEDIHLFAESVEHVPMLSLIHLYSLGNKIGFDVNPYIGEILYRVGISIFPLFLAVPVSYSTLKYRSFKVGLIRFFLHTTLVWFMVSLLDILPSKAGISPLPVLALYLLYALYILRSLYYLGKGFRV